MDRKTMSEILSKTGKIEIISVNFFVCWSHEKEIKIMKKIAKKLYLNIEELEYPAYKIYTLELNKNNYSKIL